MGAWVGQVLYHVSGEELLVKDRAEIERLLEMPEWADTPAAFDEADEPEPWDVGAQAAEPDPEPAPRKKRKVRRKRRKT